MSKCMILPTILVHSIVWHLLGSKQTLYYHRIRAHFCDFIMIENCKSNGWVRTGVLEAFQGRIVWRASRAAEMNHAKAAVYVVFNTFFFVSTRALHGTRSSVPLPPAPAVPDPTPVPVPQYLEISIPLPSHPVTFNPTPVPSRHLKFHSRPIPWLSIPLPSRPVTFNFTPIQEKYQSCTG